jgi:hypothetical protein
LHRGPAGGYLAEGSRRTRHGGRPISAPAAEPDAPPSSATLSVLSGPPITLWGTDPDTDPGARTAADLDLGPDRPVIVGRQEGRRIEYLDPAYCPTRVVPDTGQSVLLAGGKGDDVYVSRGHFMLRGVAAGVVLTNGVPRRGGGIRPPVNGTWLVAPVARRLEPGEEVLVERGTAVVIRLPNHCVIQIIAR